MTPRLLGLLAACAASLPAFPPPACSLAQGQAYIDTGLYSQAVIEFTCVIDAQPTEVEGYRGRIEAELQLGQFSNAVRDYARVTAYVIPVHPDAQQIIQTGYATRLAAAPDSIPALAGASFSRWFFFDYAQAIHILNHLVAVAPNNVYGNLFLGSSRMLRRAAATQGPADLERALALAPASPDVRFIIADAYTYGQPDANRAISEALLALQWGLDTPRIHAILAVNYTVLGNVAAAAAEIKIHLEQVTTQLVATAPLAVGGTLSLPLVPGRTYETPVAITAGQTLTVKTSSKDFYDTILVLLAPDGTPVIESDDDMKYFAGLNWVAGSTGVYRMRVSSFESVDTGELVVSRK